MEFEKFLKRIKIATDIKNQTDLADALGVRQATISDAKKRNSVPAEWLMKIYRSHNLSPVWLADNFGQMYVENRKSSEAEESSEAAETEPKYGSAELLDVNMLTDIIENTEKYSEDKKYFPSAHKKAKIISLMYCLSMEEKKKVTIDAIARHLEFA